MYEKLIRREFGGSEKVQRDINTALVGLTVDKFFTSKEIRTNINTFILKAHTALYPNKDNPNGIVMILGKTFKGTDGKLEFINDNTKTRPEALVSFSDLVDAIALTEEKIPPQEFSVSGDRLLTADGVELSIGKLNGLTMDQLPISEPTQTALNSKVSGDNITYVSDNQQNNIMMINNGKLFTTSGYLAPYPNSGTGRGYSGSLHVSTSLGRFTEVVFDGIPSTAKVIKAGGNGGCINYALFDNNWLYTWGSNEYGVCGHGHVNAIPTPVLVTTECTDVYDNTNWNDVYMEYSVFLYKHTDGYVYGSGYNEDNPLGLPNSSSVVSIPERLTWLGTNPRYVGGNLSYHGVGYYQKADGSIWASGVQTKGVLFNGVSATTSTGPVDITSNVGGNTAGDIVFHHYGVGYDLGDGVVVEKFLALLLRRDSNNKTTLYTVGDNTSGQIGSGLLTNRTIPYLVPNMDAIHHIAVTGGGRPTVHVITSNKDLYTWGYNGVGVAGRPLTETVIYSPTLIMTGVDQFFTTSMSSEVLGFRTSMFIKRGDDVLVTGVGTWYMSGVGSFDNLYGYTRIPELSSKQDPVVRIASLNTKLNSRTFMAVTLKQQVKVWGSGGESAISKSLPNSIPTPESFPLNIPKDIIVPPKEEEYPQVVIDDLVFGVSISDLDNMSKVLKVAEVTELSYLNWILYGDTLPSMVSLSALVDALDTGLSFLQTPPTMDTPVNVLFKARPGFIGATYKIDILSMYGIDVLETLTINKTSSGWSCVYNGTTYNVPDGVLGVNVTTTSLILVVDGVIQTTISLPGDVRTNISIVNSSAVASSSITYTSYQPLPYELYMYALNSLEELSAPVFTD